MQLSFEAILEKFGSMGEKSGWTYIKLPKKVTEKLNPGVKKAYRVKGFLNNYTIAGVATVPMGDGNFIIAINATMRKAIRKQIGDKIFVQLSLDEGPLPLNAELLECVAEELEAKSYFESLAPSHQLYFSRYVDAAKTEPTKIKRLAQIINALCLRWDYGQMIRAGKKDRM